MKSPFQKRVNKSKEQLLEEVRRNQKTNHDREILRKVFAIFDKDFSISDVTAHVDVLAGLIIHAQKKATNEMTVGSLGIDLGVKAAPHPELLQAVYDVIKDEKAPDELAALLTKFMDHIKYQVKEVAFIEKKIESLDLELMLK